MTPPKSFGDFILKNFRLFLYTAKRKANNNRPGSIISGNAVYTATNLQFATDIRSKTNEYVTIKTANGIK